MFTISYLEVIYFRICAIVMFWFSLDTLILNLVVFSLCMTLHFGDITTSSKKILSTVAGRWRVRSLHTT